MAGTLGLTVMNRLLLIPPAAAVRWLVYLSAGDSELLVIELSNSVETIDVPHRAAYAGGSYEVTNSNLQPGAGEMLVKTALSLLLEAGTN